MITPITAGFPKFREYMNNRIRTPKYCFLRHNKVFGSSDISKGH